MDNCKRIDELALKFKENFDFENNCIKDSYKKKVFWELSQLHISSVDVSFNAYDHSLQECDYEIEMEEGFKISIDVSNSIFGFKFDNIYIISSNIILFLYLYDCWCIFDIV